MIRTAKVKVNGKINIGLNILGREGEFHSLDTVVWEINLYDVITVRTRKDKKINLAVKGHDMQDVCVADNNVYKAAKLFIERFGCNGCDITLQKNIPVGSGLGGSSADIVGTFKALAKVYGVEEDLKPLVLSMCSDGEFLLEGGCARLTGRGTVVRKIKPIAPLYLVIVIPDGGSVTADVFSAFDEGKYASAEADIEEIVNEIESEQFRCKDKMIFNALYEPAARSNKEIAYAFSQVKALSPDCISMSGSGSAVYGVFSSPELCLWAQAKLKDKFTVFVKETIV